MKDGKTEMSLLEGRVFVTSGLVGVHYEGVLYQLLPGTRIEHVSGPEKDTTKHTFRVLSAQMRYGNDLVPAQGELVEISMSAWEYFLTPESQPVA
ncbi:hypothetical protein A2415_05405 [candidate division WWE3 bacterium RIFOXYC1_FULL_39_7]|uniref:Uncharacterized protein n=2 Tax=Katanobacteria TaxID=422282 RepID=A0A1F4XBG8_UNCKA|nr:MAG: hypothetical protein A2415_05405 [candidate division WWE3 bacterium RIFOXYC1_FULL_39_7]OGC78413.1 MAG: hypothetical protein A2619_00925 [candidate division WWE3 bacterium RIFOXYD1_FULL_39_9]